MNKAIKIVLFQCALSILTITSYAQFNSSYYSNPLGIGGTENCAFGYNSLNNFTSGYRNSALGNNSLSSNTTGYDNTAIGNNSMLSNSTGFRNIAVGAYSLTANSTGSSNIAVGHNSLSSNTTGRNNVAVGGNSLSSNTTGKSNIAIGLGSLESNSTGFYNCGIGQSALQLNDTGFSNTAVGINSLGNNTSGNWNSALGVSALANNDNGMDNVAVGTDALFSNLSSFNNTAIGSLAGAYNQGDSNVFIGYAAGCNEVGSNKFYISNDSTNTLIYGDFSSHQILLGKSNPTDYAFKGNRTLNVLGGILTDSIRVALGENWADYVFNENYNLQPLNKVEDFIKENKHLPGIPTSQEVIKNGVNIADINAKLLEKIEELTLYMIQQQKEIDELKKLVKQSK